MPLTLICPNLRCRSILQVPETIRGEKVRCSKCGRNFLVPTAAPPRPREPKPDQPPTEQPAS